MANGTEQRQQERLTRMRLAERELQQHETVCPICRYPSLQETCPDRQHLVVLADRSRR